MKRSTKQPQIAVIKASKNSSESSILWLSFSKNCELAGLCPATTLKWISDTLCSCFTYIPDFKNKHFQVILEENFYLCRPGVLENNATTALLKAVEV